MIQISVPGKLIISGEHAVVYGSPALAASINKYVHATLTEISREQCEFVGFDQFQITFTYADFWQRFHALKVRYENFLQGKCSVNEISQDWFDLPLHVLGQFFEYTSVQPKVGLHFKIEGDLPIGYGLGSSAAIIVAVLRAIADYYHKKLSLSELLHLAMQTENLQHGHSSGLDPSVCLHGGVVLYGHGENIKPRHLKSWFVHMINTGHPQSTTGECVAWVKQQNFPTKLWQHFTEVTMACDKALQQQKTLDLRAAIRENHRLLCQIGVVPEHIQSFIAKLEAQGYAAKICGAGSIKGDSAGYLLVIGTSDISSLTSQYKFKMDQIQLGV